MAVDYNVKKEPGFLRVIGACEVTAKTMQQFCEMIPELGRKSDVSRILLDHRNLPISLTTTEHFQCATEIAEHFRGFMLAVVQDPPLLISQRFGETVARNRGATLRVFGTVEEAYVWLGVEPANKLEPS
jgi:hypothetical protein